MQPAPLDRLESAGNRLTCWKLLQWVSFNTPVPPPRPPVLNRPVISSVNLLYICQPFFDHSRSVIWRNSKKINFPHSCSHHDLLWVHNIMHRQHTDNGTQSTSQQVTVRTWDPNVSIKANTYLATTDKFAGIFHTFHKKSSEHSSKRHRDNKLKWQWLLLRVDGGRGEKQNSLLIELAKPPFKFWQITT